MKLTVFFTIVKFFSSLYFADLYPGEEGVSRRIENITKPPSEKRLYRGLHLKNGMKILLISDPTTTKSAVTLDIGVGALNDFVGVQGLANLTGYALITDNHCDPKYVGFLKFIEEQNRGTLQMALTREHEQIFSFLVNSWQLEKTLEKLAECLIKPHFFNGHCGLVLNTALDMVEIDFRERSKEDFFRIIEVEKIFYKEKNAFGNFFGGNRKTLFMKTPNTLSLLDKVKSFYKTWYSSNIMTLVVLGREDLDKLEQSVVPLFNNIANREAKKFNYHAEEKHPQGQEQLGFKIYIVALEEKHTVCLKFPVPDHTEKYKTAPEQFIGDLIVDKGPGSLSDLLKKTGLCLQINAETKASVGVAFFSISCSLTIAGFHKVDDVISLIFQYIHLIKEEGVQEKIFNELRNRRYLLFYDDDATAGKSVDTFVEDLAILMQNNYPLEEILMEEFIEWDQSLIEKYLEYLTPINMNVSIVSPLVRRQAICKKKEKYYGTFYCSEKIPKNLINKWSLPELIPEMKLPKPNEFMAENFDVYPEDPHEQKPWYPQMLHKSLKTEIWYKQDDIFRIPKLAVYFEIFSSASHHSPLMQILWDIFTSEIIISLERILELGGLAGFDCTIVPQFNKIEVKIFGLNDKLPTMLERLLSSMIDFKVDLDEENIQRLIENWMQEFEKKWKDHSVQVQWSALRVRESEFDDVDETTILKLIRDKGIHPEQFEKFYQKLFKRIFIRGLIHGNCTKEKAMEIVHIFENTFQFSHGLLLQEILPSRVNEMAEGLHYIYQEFNEDHNIYAYAFQFQTSNNPLNIFNYVVSRLVSEIIERPCEKLLSDLEYKKSLNLPSNCIIAETNNVRALSIEIFSGKFPHYVDKRVENFLRETCNTMNYISKSDFELLKRITEEKWLSHLSDIQNITAQYFNAIEYRYYNFNRLEMIRNELRAVKKVDVLLFCRTLLHTASLKRRKLSIYVLPEVVRKTKPSLLEIPQGATKIKDLQTFSSSCNLLPVTFVRKYSTEWAVENNITDYSSSFASTSSGYIAEQNKKPLPPPVQTAVERSTIVPKQDEITAESLSQIIETILGKFSGDTEKQENVPSEIPCTEETSGKNITKDMVYQKRKCNVQSLNQVQSISKNLTEDNRQISHTGQTITGNSPEIAEPRKKSSRRMRRRIKQAIQEKEDGKPKVSHQTPFVDQTSLHKLSEIYDDTEQLKQTSFDNRNIGEDMVEITYQEGEAHQSMPPGLKKTSENIYEQEEKLERTSISNQMIEEVMTEITDQEREVHQPMPHSHQETSENIDENTEKLEQTSINHPQIEKGVTEITDQEREVRHQLMPPYPQEILENITGAESEIFLSNDSIAPESLYIYPMEENEPAEPYIIYQSPLSEFWFKQDAEFQLPNLDIFLDFLCPISRLHPSNFVQIYIFASLLKSIMITKYGYRTQLGDSKWNIDANSVDFKIEISMSSAGDQMATILEKLGAAIVDIENEVDDKIFLNEKHNSINYWTKLNSKVGSLHLNWCLKSIMSQNAWTVPDLISAATSLKFDTWKKFLPKLFSGVFIRGLIIGNSNKENARKIVDIIERPFKSRTRGFLPLEISARRAVQLNDGTHFVHYIFNEEPDIYEYWEQYFKLESEIFQSDIINVLGSLLKFIIENSESARIQDNRRYEILTEDMEGGLTLAIRAISKQFITHASMDTFANNFIHRVDALLRNLSSSQFAEHIKELQSKLLMNNETNASELNSLFWKEISEREYYFERREVMVDQLYFVSRGDVLTFFKEMFIESRRRHKLTIYSFPKMKKQDVLSEIPDGATEIVNITAFQNTSMLLPRV